MREERDRWIHPDNFSYTLSQLRWIIGLIPWLRAEGLTWPLPPATDGVITHEQYYEGRIPEKGAVVIGNIERILCEMGRPGLMVKMYYSAREDIEMIARYFRVTEKQAGTVIDNTLRRVCYRMNGHS